MSRVLEVHRLGVVPYAAGLEIQKRLVDERKAGRIPDQLLLLEHPPVITLGVRVRDDPSHFLASRDLLAREGVEVFETGRGGDITYHGPGQLVGYPIIDLNPGRRDVHRYVRDIEQVMIRAAANFGVNAHRVNGLTGAWVGDEKLAAIGVRISRWITSHGFAFNVTTNLRHFELIVPCGIRGKGTTSLLKLLGRPIRIDEVANAIVDAFAGTFEANIAAGSPIHVPTGSSSAHASS